MGPMCWLLGQAMDIMDYSCDTAKQFCCSSLPESFAAPVQPELPQHPCAAACAALPAAQTAPLAACARQCTVMLVHASYTAKCACCETGLHRFYHHAMYP